MGSLCIFAPGDMERMLHHEAKMAVEEWFLQEEGCLQFNGRPTSISYSPTSHCFIATLEDGSIEVLDVSSGRTLKRTYLEGIDSSESSLLQCRFCPEVEKLFVSNANTVGLRKDLNGVLLLDTVLQAPIDEDCDSPITLELTIADAKQFLAGIELCIPTAVPPVLEVLETLREQLKEELSPHQTASAVKSTTGDTTGFSSDESDKAAKWNTCKVRLAAGALLFALDGLVAHLHKNHRTSTGLPIASAMLARVMALAGISVLEKRGQPVYKQLMFVEAARRQTFSPWPHADYKWAYPEAMAQAGFYHQPACPGDDRAMCFTCSVCLVCWEPTDEPWSEHERHSAECPFVRGDRTENVPMGVSLATTPAKCHGNSRTSRITSISSSSCPCLMATSSDNGHIVVWDLSDQLKVYSQFMVDLESETKQPKTRDLTSLPEAWTNSTDTANNDIVLDQIEDAKGSNIPVEQVSHDELTPKDDLDEQEAQPQEHDDESDKHPDESQDENLVTKQAENNTENQIKEKNVQVNKQTDISGVEEEGETDSKDECDSSPKEDDSEIRELELNEDYNIDVGSGDAEEEDIIEVSCEFSEEDGESCPIIEEPDETCDSIVEEPDDIQMQSNNRKSAAENSEDSSTHKTKSKTLHVTASAIMCSPDQDHQHLKKLHTVDHRPVVIAGVHPCRNSDSSKTKEQTPYLLLFDASSDRKPAMPKTDKQPGTTTSKPGPKVASVQPYGDSQEDLYSIISSDDDFDQDLIMTSPGTMQSSVMKKCAEAISGKSEQHNDDVKMKKHNIIQKLSFPSDVVGKSSIVSQIIPCLDGHHVLIVVHLHKQHTEVSSQGENVYLDHELNCSNCTICNEEKKQYFNRYQQTDGCLLVLYQLILSNNTMPTLSEPLVWKELLSDNTLFNVIGIPVDTTEHLDYSKGLFLCDIDDDTNTSMSTDATTKCNGRFAGITQDGSILILNANSLDVLTKFSPTGVVNAVSNRFNDIVYCPGINCLCCSTLQGNLFFLSLVHNQESTDSEGTCQGKVNGTDAMIESISLTEECTIQNLLKLLQKTEFENLVPRFTAIVPPSWSEVQQEQQQRQHPQHLHQQGLGDATLHTRTWRLQPEGKSIATGEQIFELLLPKQCHVGHIDIKFTLNSTNSSTVNVYLLKPWSLKSWQVEHDPTLNNKKVPILSTAKENGHILCGPVEIQKSSHQRVALTCPDLVKTRHRVLLVVFETEQTICPLEEISLTVRRFKYSPQSNPGFLHYVVMLEEPAFQHRLLEVVCSQGQNKMLVDDVRRLALNLLCWVAGMCVHTPIRKNSLIHQVQAKLQDIIPVCFLQSGRSVAHQCSVLLMLCARQSKWDEMNGISNKTEQPFRSAILQAILHVLPDTTNVHSAGALHALYSLLIGYAALAEVKQTSIVCQELLIEVSTKMDSLMLNSHNILQGRYGLYGSPFEPVLFDLSLPPTSIPQPTSSTQLPANLMPYYYTQHQPVSMVFQSQAKSYIGPAGPRDPPTSTASSSKTTEMNKATGLQDLEVQSDSGQYLLAHQGLLEVEPLHFTCISTSDGAKVERAESAQVVGTVTGLPSAAAAAAASGQTLSSMLPSVSVSTEPDIEFLKQHYQQLAKIQLQQKQVLEKHKQELEELAIWSLFPKMMPKLEQHVTGGVSSGSDVWESSGQPYSIHHSGVSVNLAQQKKSSRKTSSKGLSSLTPIHKQHSQLPQPQALVIERLHSGARHHVVLDFGSPMELTDIIISSKSDLSSLSIDAWLEGEEKDAQRIAIVSDIGTCDCVLKDLHPPPVCQFVKLTVVGRPRSNARMRMEIGEFYGRPNTPAIIAVHEEPDHRLQMLESLYEEVHCHYSLACGKLETQLNNPDKEDTKLQTVYQQCIDLQLQLNFVYHSISRLQYHKVQNYKAHGYDQMRVLCTCLVETLVSLAVISKDDKGFLAKTKIPVEPQVVCSSLTWDLCEVLFRNLCIRGNPVLRVRVAALLLHTCGSQPWWGNFLAQILQHFFSSSQHLVFPQERVFVVLCVLAQQSPDIAGVLSSLLSLLHNVLSTTSKKGVMDVQGIDISLVGWVVLLLSHVLNICCTGRSQQTAQEKSSDSSSSTSSSKTVTAGPSDKWDFIVPSPATRTNQPTANLTGYRHRHHKLRSKLSKHDKHLQKQQAIVIDFHEGEPHGSEAVEIPNVDTTFIKVKSKMTSHALKQHIKDLMKLRHHEVESAKSKKSSSKSKSKKTEKRQTSVPMLLPQTTTIPVMKKMMQLVLAMDQSCSVDLVLTICKVVALLSSISQPTVLVTDILNQSQVESMLRLCINDWGGPWTRHALITLLQDLLQGYKGSAKSVQTDPQDTKPEAKISAVNTATAATSQPQAKDQPTDTQNAVSNQELWSMIQNIPTDPFMSWGVDMPVYDLPPPVPSPPYTETSNLVIPPKPVVSSTETTSPMVKVSSALDARLELGVTMVAEWDFKTLQMIQREAVLKGMTTSHLQRAPGYKLSKKPISTSTTSIIEVFSNCFDKLFSECNSVTVNLGHLLELWLRLNGFLTSLHTTKTTLFIPLSQISLNVMLAFLADCPTVSLQNLYLAFEVMRIVLEKTTDVPIPGSPGRSPGNSQEEAPSLTRGLVNNPDLERVLHKTLIEGSPKDYGTETGVGTAGTGIKQVEVFLSTLAVALEKQHDSDLLAKYYSMLLGLLCSLAAENVNSTGRPLQVKPILRAFLKHPPSSTKTLDMSLINKLLQLTMQLSLQHLRKSDDIALRASSHFHETPRLTTSTHALETKSTNEPWIVHSTWLTKLLSLIIMLLQIPAEDPQEREVVEGEAASTDKECTPTIEGVNNSTSGIQTEIPLAADKGTDNMVKTLQAMAKAVEQNASQSNEEQHPIINVIEEDSSSSMSETETSGAEEDESLQSADTGSQADEKSEVVIEAKEESSNTHIETSSPPLSPRLSKSALPDQIILYDEICLNLLECLNLCSSNNIGVLLTGANILNNTSTTPVSGEPVSVEDGILQVISVIFSQLTHKDMLVSTVIKFLSGRERPEGIPSRPVTQLSEPFLWFLLRVLDLSKQVDAFSAQGGYELLFTNLVASYRVQLDDKKQDLIPVMRHLTKLAHNPSDSSVKLLLNAVWDAEKDNGLVNYAPFGSISCTRPSAHPADSLLKACAPHRRARSATWSYHFYPGELWCDLTIQLPTPVLIQAVYVLPHTTSLTTCPSYVALDYSVDGIVMIPASKPVMTSGLSVIKMQFIRPQIAQRVCIRCRRPRDSESLGLSQIKVWGSSLYGPPPTHLDSSIEITQTDCLNWICLLNHCLHRTSPEALKSLSSSQQLHQVFRTCISLLGSNQSELFLGCQEDVLLTLALEFSDLGQLLLRNLLVNPGHGKQSVSVCSSAVQLVYKLGQATGPAAAQRLHIIGEWLSSLSSQAHISTATDNGLTGLVQAVAGVIWTSGETSDLARAVQEEIKEPLFRSIYEWSQLVEQQEPLKQAIDYLICSLCHVCPSYYQLLLHLTKAQNLVDQARTQDNTSLPVFVNNPSTMETLSRTSQSPITSHLLLASGVLNVLHDSTLLLCNKLLMLQSTKGLESDDEGVCLSLEHLADVLSFMASCAEEPDIKTWFGESGCKFWKPLLMLLGSGVLFSSVLRIGQQPASLPPRYRIILESATINFFGQCIACHSDNQTLFARLLCDVMANPCGMLGVATEHAPVDTRGVGLDGFLRRLLLEVLLQDEVIKVCVHYSTAMKSLRTAQENDFSHNRDWHPRFGAGYDVFIFKGKLASTFEDLYDVIFPNAHPSSKTTKDNTQNDDDEKISKLKGELDELNSSMADSDLLEGLTVAAGINVKSKRAKASSLPRKISRQKLDASLLRQNSGVPICRHHSILGDLVIPTKMTLSSLVNALMTKGLPVGTNCIEISLKTCGTHEDHGDSLLQSQPLSSVLHKFASFNGLAILSSRLSCPVVVNQDSSADSNEIPLPLAFPLPLFSLSASVLSRIPGHSLAAFGLFICLPGYPEVLLQDRPKAQCLLRLLLGAEDDGNGGHVLSSQVASSLPTLPFQILRLLFNSKPLSNEDGVSLREMSLQQGAMQLVLTCLGVLSHHEPRVVSPTDRLALQAVAALTGNLLRGSDSANTSEKQYWAKGTGFGTGSTSSDWDIENAMKKQRAEEAHSTCMLQVIASYIRPSGAQKLGDVTPPDYTDKYPDSDRIPLAMMELLARSCLVPTLSSYLRNDSVLDMARHVPLYQAVLEVMRALATCPCLVHLLTPDDTSDGSTSLAALIFKMKQCVDTYSKTLRSTSQVVRRSKQTKKPSLAKPSTTTATPTPSPTTPIATSTSLSSQGDTEGEQDTKEADAEGLALLIPDIQSTATLIENVLSHLHDSKDGKSEGGTVKDGEIGVLRNVDMSSEDRYMAIMKPLQFDMYEIISEEDSDRLEFNISYHFTSTLRSATSNGEMGSPARARRLAQEITSLSTSLPLSSSSSVFVRCDQTRLDIMKVLITGPAETPYANGCFEFDVYFPHNYPNAPMQINFETTGHHTIRFNPNLYNDGKVCLSILNTWHGRPEEKWNPQTSSFLQVLVSTQSLILVAEPYFNEPGYERSRGTASGKQNSQEYNANIRQATVKWAMLEQLRKPCKCFKEVIESHFYLKKDEILQQCETWIREIEALTLRDTSRRGALHHLHSLRQHTAQLRIELDKLSPPKQLQDK